MYNRGLGPSTPQDFPVYNITKNYNQILNILYFLQDLTDSVKSWRKLD
jgi:hypothetical protein